MLLLFHHHEKIFMNRLNRNACPISMHPSSKFFYWVDSRSRYIIKGSRQFSCHDLVLTGRSRNYFVMRCKQNVFLLWVSGKYWAGSDRCNLGFSRKRKDSDLQRSEVDIFRLYVPPLLILPPLPPPPPHHPSSPPVCLAGLLTNLIDRSCTDPLHQNRGRQQGFSLCKQKYCQEMISVYQGKLVTFLLILISRHDVISPRLYLLIDIDSYYSFLPN